MCSLGPDHHVQVFWKHKSIGNQAYDWLTVLCFSKTLTYASKKLAHDPALNGSHRRFPRKYQMLKDILSTTTCGFILSIIYLAR